MPRYITAGSDVSIFSKNSLSLSLSLSLLTLVYTRTASVELVAVEPAVLVGDAVLADLGLHFGDGGVVSRASFPLF